MSRVKQQRTGVHPKPETRTRMMRTFYSFQRLSTIQLFGQTVPYLAIPSSSSASRVQHTRISGSHDTHTHKTLSTRSFLWTQARQPPVCSATTMDDGTAVSKKHSRQSVPGRLGPRNKVPCDRPRCLSFGAPHDMPSFVQGTFMRIPISKHTRSFEKRDLHHGLQCQTKR